MSNIIINISIAENLKEEIKPDTNNHDYDPFYSPENMLRLQNSIQELETSGGTIREVIYND